MPDLKRIAVVTDLTQAYCRGVMKGVLRFAVTQPAWSVQNATLKPGVAEAMHERGVDAVVGHFSRAVVVDEFARLGLPVVNTSNVFPDLPYPRFGVDDTAVGRMAAEHLIERGLRHLACNADNTALGRLRAAGFTEAVSAAGLEVVDLYQRRSPIEESEQFTLAGAEQRAATLRALPKPVGVFAQSDGYASTVISDCRRAALNVPGDVAVVGVDNDEMLCNGFFPSISSVVLPGERIGYRAAQALDRIMRGQQARGACEPDLLPPVGVEARLSTDVQVTESPVVAKALNIIRDRAADGINVQDVLDAVGCSRSTLDQAFRKYLGHTPLHEIHRQRIKRVKRLLAETNMTVEAIALGSGFASAQRLWDIFRKHEGVSPAVYREQALTSGTAQYS